MRNKKHIENLTKHFIKDDELIAFDATSSKQLEEAINTYTDMEYIGSADRFFVNGYECGVGLHNHFFKKSFSDF